MQSAAIRLLSGIPGKDVTDLLVRHRPGLSAAGQVRLLSALGERGDASASSAAAQAVQSGEPGVRTAAVTALGQLGDAASVMVLANAAASAEGAERTAARESLYGLRGAEVEAAIVSGIGSAAGGARLELIRAAGERWLAASGTALIGAARDPDPQVRRESLRALRNAAAPRDSRVLLDLMIATTDDSDRREAARALASALRRSERQEIGPVIAAYRSAREGEVRAALLEVMGQVSASQALPVLRSALHDSQPEIVRAAILSLAEWATPEPLPDLFAVARNGAIPAHRILALRGSIQLIATASNRPMKGTVDLLGEAMQIAKQPEEKRAILSMLANYPTEEALRIAESVSGDSTVAREAKYAVGRIQLGLRAQRR